MVSMKKAAMKHIWRLQQVGGILSVMMLSVTITLSLMDKIDYLFIKRFEMFGIPPDIDYDYLIFFIIAPLIFLLAIGAGYLYDRTFQMWRAQNEVAAERNPFAKTMLTPKEIVVWENNTIPMLRGLGRKDEADFMERWIERVLRENPSLRRETEEIGDYVG